jgi:isoquinoline 1-oxidoreductase alpha subunit
MAFTLLVNGESVEVDVEPQMPLLWVLRDELGLTGTKFGCGIAACGACTVQIDGAATRTCVFPVSAADGKTITTIEGLATREARPAGSAETRLHPVQQAWIEHQVPQCGYCQSGMIMAVAALLDSNPDPTDDELAASVTNICRCGTYERVRGAVRSLAGTEMFGLGGTTNG